MPEKIRARWARKDKSLAATSAGFAGRGPAPEARGRAVSAGGIRSAGDIARLKETGVDAILVGESLVRQSPEQRKRKAKQFVRAGQER